MPNVDRVFQIEAGVVSDRPSTATDRQDTENLIPCVGATNKPIVREGIEPYKTLTPTATTGRVVHLVDLNEREKSRLVAVQDTATGAIVGLWDYKEQTGRAIAPAIRSGRGSDVPLYFERSIVRDDEYPFLGVYSMLGNLMEYHYLHVSGTNEFPRAITKLPNGIIAVHTNNFDYSAAYIDFFRLRTLQSDGGAYSAGATDANDAILTEPFKTVQLNGAASFKELDGGREVQFAEVTSTGIAYFLTRTNTSAPTGIQLHKFNAYTCELIEVVTLPITYGTGYTYGEFSPAKLDKDGYIVGMLSTGHSTSGFKHELKRYNPDTGVETHSLDMTGTLSSQYGGLGGNKIVPMSGGKFCVFRYQNTGVNLGARVYAASFISATINLIGGTGALSGQTGFFPAVELGGANDTCYYFVQDGSNYEFRKIVDASGGSPVDSKIKDFEVPDFDDYYHVPAFRMNTLHMLYGTDIINIADGEVVTTGPTGDFFNGHLIETSIPTNPSLYNPNSKVSDPFMWYRSNFAGAAESP